MVYGKHEKLHNTQNVNFYSSKNMPKSNLHPEWFNDTIILCDGKPLSITSSTKKELQVDMWLANHPFYSKSQLITDSEGRVERFMKKYGLSSTD